MRTMRTFLALIFILVGTAGLALSEDGPRPTRMLSPFFFIEGENPGIDSFPLKSTDVVANISGVIADVTVTQVYENHGTGPIHGRYVFPGSTRAAVHGMSIRVGDKAVVAKIRERQKAAREFEEAKAAGKNAALLEQQRPNVDLRIDDEAPGIPEFARPRVFEKFFSLERPETGKKSTGLGLNFAKEVALLHGGTVDVNNLPERGLQARLLLPAA